MLLQKYKLWLATVCSILFLNYAMPTALDYGVLKRKEFKDHRIQEVTQIDEYINSIPKDGSTLDFLKSAHIISSLFLQLGEIKLEEIFTEKKISLNEGRADCSYFSYFTYSNFLHLCDRFNRPEFKEDVRLSRGMTEDQGHQWLEIRINGEWINYETTVDVYDFNYLAPKPLLGLINFCDINRVITNEEVLDIMKGTAVLSCQERQDKSIRIIPREKMFRIGLAHILYKEYEPHLKYAWNFYKERLK